MTSVNMIFFMGGPQLGELEAGLVASLFASAAIGASVSVVSGGLATMLAVAAGCLAREDRAGLRRRQPARRRLAPGRHDAVPEEPHAFTLDARRP